MKTINILYEDDFIMAISKPSGVLCIPDRQNKEFNLYNFIKIDNPNIKLVHRLDKDTSGVFILAKSEQAQKKISSLFESHIINKIYHAIVVSKPMIDNGEIKNFLEENSQQKGSYRISKSKGKLAISKYKILETFKLNSLIEFDIKTGRTHQIRVHAKSIGCPLAYDDIYNPDYVITVSMLKNKYKFSKDIEQPIIRRLSLHAYNINFICPFTTKTIDIVCPYPKDFENALKILRKY